MHLIFGKDTLALHEKLQGKLEQFNVNNFLIKIRLCLNYLINAQHLGNFHKTV